MKRQMSHSDVARIAVNGIRIAHCMYPAWEAGELTSVSNASSIAVSFTAQRHATVEIDGISRDRNIPAGSFGTAGAAPITWLRVREPSECIEVTAPDALRRRLARELNVDHNASLDDLYGQSDPIVWMIAVRLRALLRRRSGDTLEFDALTMQLYRRLLQSRFGGRETARGDGGLSPARLAHVLEWIDAHLMKRITIGELADVAALTTSHFIRSFKRTVGVSPYQYVRARRLERTRDALARGANVQRAASLAGYLSPSQFAQAFHQHFGYPPTLTPIRGERHWSRRGVSS